MEIEISNGILKNIATPTFPINISSSTNKIFIKYIDNKIRKNHIDIIFNLCKNSNFKNKESLLYQTLIFHDLILYNCGNDNIIKDIDLMILTTFFISIKAICTQISLITIEQLKKLNNKFSHYKNEEIVQMEILCLKILKYKINVLTCYDCLKIIMLKHQVNDDFSETAKDLLHTIIFGDIKDYIFKLPYNLALEVFEKVKLNFNQKPNIKYLDNENKKKQKSIINEKNNILKSYILQSQKMNYNENPSEEFSTSQNSSVNSSINFKKNIIRLNNNKSNLENVNFKKMILGEPFINEYEKKNEFQKKNELNNSKNINDKIRKFVEMKKNNFDENKKSNIVEIKKNKFEENKKSNIVEIKTINSVDIKKLNLFDKKNNLIDIKKLHLFDNKKYNINENIKKDNKNENKKLEEHNDNHLNIDFLGKNQLNIDFKSLALISKRLKLSSLKQKPLPNSFMG